MGLSDQQHRKSSSRSTRHRARLSSGSAKSGKNPAVAHTKQRHINTVTDIGTKLAEIAGNVSKTSPFAVNEGVAELCAFRPPYGFRDSAKRISMILGAADAELLPAGFNATATASLPNATSLLCALFAHAIKKRVSAAPSLKKTRAAASPATSKYSTCAIVGSSGSLLGSNDGAEIDAHEAVFRFNEAPLGEAYARDVGSRVTFWVSSHVPWARRVRQYEAVANTALKQGSAQEVSRAFQEAPFALLYCFNPWLGACQSNLLIGPRTPKPAVARPPTRLPKQLPSRSATYLLNPILSMHADAMQQAVGGSRRGSVRPSTGLLGLMLGLAMCESTTLFGFGNDTDSSTAGTCNHYWECKYDQTRYFSGKMGNHDWHAQWRVISQLAEREIVRYHASTRNVSV